MRRSIDRNSTMDLNHLHLHVADIARARAFYETFLGMKERVWHGEILFLTNDDGFDLALAPGEPAVLPRWFHFGFRLSSREAVHELHDRMAKGGAGALDPCGDEPDMCWFRCADPDGHSIEIYWE